MFLSYLFLHKASYKINKYLDVGHSVKPDRAVHGITVRLNYVVESQCKGAILDKALKPKFKYLPLTRVSSRWTTDTTDYIKLYEILSKNGINIQIKQCRGFIYYQNTKEELEQQSNFV